MYKTKSARSLAQAISIIAAVVVLVSGVTFAALQSQQAVLKGNSIQTAVADLKLSKDGANYASSLDGYTFSNLIPGGGAFPANGNPIYLMNNGSTTLALKLSLNPGLTNPDGVDLTKVHVTLTPSGGGAPQGMTLQELITANSTGGIPITVGNGGSLGSRSNVYYAMRIVMDADSVSNASATIGNMVFNFDATAVN